MMNRINIIRIKFLAFVIVFVFPFFDLATKEIISIQVNVVTHLFY